MAGPVYPKFTKFSLNAIQYDVQPSSFIGRKDEFVNANGLRGHLDDAIEMSLPGIYRVNGQTKMFPSPTVLQTILPIIFGTAVSTITYALAQTATGYTIVVQRGDGTTGMVHTYAAAKAAKCRFHGNGHNNALGLDIDWVGTTEAEGAAGSFGSPAAINLTTRPWVFQEITCSVDGTTVKMRSFEFTVDGVFDADRIFNDQTLNTAANWTDRKIPVEIMVPYGDYMALYTSSMVYSGVPVVITATNGVYILTFTLAKVAFRRSAPEADSMTGEMMLPLRGVAMRSSATLPIVTTMAIS